MVKLTPRLQTIADLVGSCERLADVGTDHGYLPIYLVFHERVKGAIASDLNVGPLESARNAVEIAGFEEEIELRLGSGLLPYSSGEVDVIVIAGMGGQLMASLLDQGELVAKQAQKLILQPMQACAELREWLSQNQYEIVEEHIAKEGDKYYEIMVVKAGAMKPLSWDQCHLGVNMVKSPQYIEFLSHKLRIQDRIIEGLKRGGRLEQLELANKERDLIFTVLDRARG